MAFCIESPPFDAYLGIFTTNPARPMRIALLLLCLVLVRPGAAQDLMAEIKLGVAGSTLIGETEDFTTVESQTSWGGGAALGYDAGNGFILKSELMYLIKGAEGTSQIDGIPIHFELDIVYVEVPLLVAYRIDRGHRWSPKVFAGPYLGYKGSARIRYQALTGGPTFDEEDQTVESWDYGLTAGAGLEYLLGSERLSLELRGAQGLANARMREPALHNRSFVLALGIVF
jgi:hypothetical protein